MWARVAMIVGMTAVVTSGACGGDWAPEEAPDGAPINGTQAQKCEQVRELYCFHAVGCGAMADMGTCRSSWDADVVDCAGVRQAETLIHQRGTDLPAAAVVPAPAPAISRSVIEPRIAELPGAAPAFKPAVALEVIGPSYVRCLSDLVAVQGCPVALPSSCNGAFAP